MQGTREESRENLQGEELKAPLPKRARIMASLTPCRRTEELRSRLTIVCAFTDANVSDDEIREHHRREERMIWNMERAEEERGG